MSDPATSPPARRPGAVPIVAAVARKELREVWRDGRFWAIGGAVTGLLVVALAFGARQARSAQAERSAAGAIAERAWREQDDKNPHVAAHLGKFVFKPSGPLSLLDPGVEPFVGVSMKLEAHRRNAVTGARAEDGTGLSRFARLSAASVLQLLVPLLVVGLGFGAWTSERERGTLRQLASQGVRTPALLAGKTLGQSLALASVLLPALAIGVATAALLGATGADPTRVAALAGVYAGYVLVWVLLTLFVSAAASSSRGALVALLFVWVAAGLVIPRAATDAAARIAPAPSRAEVVRAIEKSLAEGLPGKGDREERVAAIAEQILEKQGFKGAETLMDASLLEGIELQAEAAFENEVLDHHFGRLGAAIEREDVVSQWASVLSPVLAVRTLSTAFAGTDFAHHSHFEHAAELYRRDLVDLLNRDFAERAGSAGWSYKAGRELWERAAPFAYTPPPASWVVRRNAVALGTLAGWLVLGALLAWWSAARMKVTA
jgi:ABC-2 type transport system permease protein